MSRQLSDLMSSTSVCVCVCVQILTLTDQHLCQDEHVILMC